MIIKRAILMMILIVGLIIPQISMNTTASASQKVAVVIVDEPTPIFKDNEKNATFKHIEKYLVKGNSNKNVTFVYGDDVQKIYRNYWLDKDYIIEPIPKKTDLISFVSYGGYDKAIYLVAKHNASFGGNTGVNAFLVDKQKILKFYISECKSYGIDMMMEKRLKDISELFLPSL